MKNINAGKIFENAFKKSIDETQIFYERIRDPAQSFNQLNSLRFSLQNPYDCFLYYFPYLYLFELKSTEQSSLTFWREDFEDKTKKQTFNIKKNQIQGLLRGSKYKGIIAGFILNFRKTNHTYFLHINDYVTMTKNLNKKSFNEEDVTNNNAYLIQQTLKKVNYKYNISEFILDIQSKI